jgi:PTH1 family peptidyl-tRNA hydrolase
MGGIEFVKIGVGIGRPLSREPSAVATYVLRKMKPQEQNEIENAAGPVIEALRAIQDGLL